MPLSGKRQATYWNTTFGVVHVTSTINGSFCRCSDDFILWITLWIRFRSMVIKHMMMIYIILLIGWFGLLKQCNLLVWVICSGANLWSCKGETVQKSPPTPNTHTGRHFFNIIEISNPFMQNPGLWEFSFCKFPYFFFIKLLFS